MGIAPLAHAIVAINSEASILGGKYLLVDPPGGFVFWR